MPRTPLERVVFALGTAALGAVLALLLLGHPRRSSSPRAQAPVGTAPVGSLRRDRPEGAPGGSGRAKAPVRTPTAPAATRLPRTVRLTLIAVRGDCWVEIRRSSRAGRTLYAGLLRQGERTSVRGGRLWLRLGGASYLDASLDGRRLSLGSGTYDAVVSGEGFRKVAS